MVDQHHAGVYYICRSHFPDRKGTKFLKIRHKMTKLWPVKQWAVRSIFDNILAITWPNFKMDNFRANDLHFWYVVHFMCTYQSKKDWS